MNPFEQFQALKPRIIAHQEFMHRLEAYAYNNFFEMPENLIHLGRGQNNTHYRIGCVDELWLATREYVSLDCFYDRQVGVSEDYINHLVQSSKIGRRVPRLCGGVKVFDGDEERAFLLVEDLTQGGMADFVPALPGMKSGRVNGEEVFYDFDTPWVNPPVLSYMTDAECIVLRR